VYLNNLLLANISLFACILKIPGYYSTHALYYCQNLMVQIMVQIGFSLEISASIALLCVEFIVFSGIKHGLCFQGKSSNSFTPEKQ
jgi:hypothetical protein